MEQAMPVMARSKNMEQNRNPLVGQYILVRDPAGHPARAGRIRGVTPSGEYLVTIYVSGKPPRGEVVTPARMDAERWELYIDEKAWRGAYTRSQ
jgi:hypothetical protein